MKRKSYLLIVVIISFAMTACFSNRISQEEWDDIGALVASSMKFYSEFAKANCEIIVCASRSKGETVWNVEKIAIDFGYNLIWTSHFSAANHKKFLPNGVDLNDEFSSAVIRLINKL